MRFSLTSLLALAAVANAWDSPTYPGWKRVWQDTFSGNSGTSPNGNNWNIINSDLGVNNELQVYSKSTRNVQLSGGNTLQLVPWRDSSKPKGWTSGRIESKYTFTPAQGKITRVEAQIMFGDGQSSRKKGIWPAFWMLGNSIRNGVDWPGCGEIDIMETVNGQLTGHGTIHCDVYPGGICNESTGIGSTIGIPSQNWQVWRVEIDRRNSDFRQQSITWFLNGNRFHQVTGSRINNANVWASLAQKPLFIIFNVAVGGNWPGNPDGNTLDGYASRQEVAYVAHYTSN